MTPVASDASSKEGTLFLQQRVAAFALMAALLGGIFWVFRVVLALVLARNAGAERQAGEYDDLTSPSFTLHGIGIAFMLLLWLLCRGKARSRAFVERSEVVCLLASVVSYEIMAATISLDAHPELILVLALTLVMEARAVYVPGTARRSLVLGVVAGVPMVASMFFAYRAGPGLPGVSPLGHALVAAAVTATWWSMTVTLTTATSHVIYGLRQRARAARQLGQYTLEEKIGEGGMGVVYRASHAMLRRPTAVKLLLPERSGEAQLARFEREVQLTASLAHPNTITVFDYGRTPDGVFYYAMELLNGVTLETLVEVDGPQPAERVAHVLEQVAGALAEAHGVGLIHRDIKPANVMLCDQGGVPDVAKVLDFGLVKNVRDDAGDRTFATGEHVITGTPQYLAPEAIRGPEGVDARSDLYSLGAVGYYLVTGQVPFAGKTVIEVLSQHLHEAPVPPAERLGKPVPPGLSKLLLRCLEKDPAARPSSAAALLEELRALELSRSWDRGRSHAWWREHEASLGALRHRRATSASAQTIAVDLAGRLHPAARLDRLEKYLAENPDA